MKKFVFMVVAVMIGLLIWGSPPAQATQGREDNVTLCHATHSRTNPFVVITVDSAGAFDGHLGVGHQDGEDIIPPFQYEGATYSQNWTVTGQAIFNNGCNIPETTTVPTPTTTVVTVPETTTTTPVTTTIVGVTEETTTTTTIVPVTPTNPKVSSPPTQLARTGFGTFILKVGLALIIIGFVLGVVSRGRRY